MKRWLKRLFCFLFGHAHPHLGRMCLGHDCPTCGGRVERED